MKASELRIGNWVKNTWSSDQAMQVYPMMISQIATLEKEQNGENASNIQALPITQEWLEKFGFIEDPEDHWSMILTLGKCTNQYLSTSFTRNNVTLYDRQKLSTGIHVAYVHQLQNLYFALTGEELTIKV